MLLRQQPTGVDFETEAIGPRPGHYPPRPIGLALRRPGQRAQYLAWGHPTGNNCTLAQAQQKLKQAMASGPVVYHNGKFDIDVGQAHLGAAYPSVDKWDDTLLLGYLHDPHRRSLELKPLAEHYLQQPPEEQDELKAWILANVQGARPGNWGEYICKAPAELVGRYACGDVDRTVALCGYFKEQLNAAHGSKWHAAYQREKLLIPLLIENEQQGLQIDVNLLYKDTKKYEQVLVDLEKWIRGKLGNAEVNLESGAQVANALEASGLAANFLVTPKGKRSTSKKSLAQAVADPILALALDYRGTLATYLQTFMRKWLEIQVGGRIYTSWNSTKQEKEDGGGTRSGRLSSSPNFQNIPSDEKRAEQEETYAPLHMALSWLPPLPQIKMYVVAYTKGEVLIGRDFGQQEPRILAHMSDGVEVDGAIYDGVLAASYRKDPRQDVYIMMLQVVKAATGIEISRKQMKALVLAIIYGLGIGNLAIKLKCTVEEARGLRAVFYQAFPEIPALAKRLKKMAAANQPFYTWGGRPYYCEPPIIKDGKRISFEYKMMNYLIQPSAADMIKETWIRYSSHPKRRGKWVLAVHDEPLACVDKNIWKQEMAVLKECMEGLPLDVQLTSDGYWGYRWGQVKECA